LRDILEWQPKHDIEDFEQVQDDAVNSLWELWGPPYVNEVRLLEHAVFDPRVFVRDDSRKSLCEPLRLEDDIFAQRGVMLEAHQAADCMKECCGASKISLITNITALCSELPVLS